MRAGIIACAAANVIWGLFPLYLKVVGFAGPLEVLGQRILWGAPLALVGIVLISGVRGGMREIRTALRPRLLLALALSAACIFGNWAIYVWAVAHNRVLDAALAYFLAPLVQVAVGVLFDKERLSAPQWAAIALASVGVIAQGVALGAAPWIALGICASWSLYSVVRKRAVVPAATGLFIETMILVPPAAALIVFLGAQNRLAFDDGVGLAFLLALLGLATAVPLTLFAFAARRLRFTTIGLLQYIAPTLQFAVGVAYGEPLNPLRIASFALIWAALGLFSYDAWRREKS